MKFQLLLFQYIYYGNFSQFGEYTTSHVVIQLCLILVILQCHIEAFMLWVLWAQFLHMSMILAITCCSGLYAH